jgi:RNA-directed DNA polymerase
VLIDAQLNQLTYPALGSAPLSRGHKFVRYADDVAIFVKSRRAGERVLASISHFLEQKLKVKVNKAKSKVGRVKDSSVLGFSIHGKKLKTLECKVQKFKQKKF